MTKLIDINYEFPRPDFRRRDWQLLNGTWSFAFDQDEVRTPHNVVFDRTITVPYVYQSKLSGIVEQDAHETVWYRKSFEVDQGLRDRSLRLIFGAVDYEATVWLNDEKLGTHVGGYSQFDFDVTPYVRVGQNELTVKVRDCYDRHTIRGKQRSDSAADRCWYEASTGIWQSVWLEAYGASKIEHALISPSIKRRNASVELYIETLLPDMAIETEVYFDDKVVNRNVYSVVQKVSKLTIDLDEPDFVDEHHYWHPDSPKLFHVHLTLLSGGSIVDEVSTYFGMREIEVRDGQIILNNRPYYQKLVLDQGYYADSMMTPPDYRTIERDIAAVKAYGFNGLRRHQVISDPRVYYCADVHGLLVWEEVPSAYKFCFNEADGFFKQCADFIKRDYNHPSVVAWCPMNESWGIRNVRYDKPQQDFVRALYHMFKAIDPTRLVSCNDGWEVVGGDFLAQHNYFCAGRLFAEQISKSERYRTGAVAGCRLSMADGYQEQSAPLILSEFGGISLSADDGWGYNAAARTEEDFLARFESFMEAIYAVEFLQGFCYTQLTDVYQETNGLLNMKREHKVAPDKIKAILDLRKS